MSVKDQQLLFDIQTDLSHAVKGCLYMYSDIIKCYRIGQSYICPIHTRFTHQLNFLLTFNEWIDPLENIISWQCRMNETFCSLYIYIHIHWMDFVVAVNTFVQYTNMAAEYTRYIHDAWCVMSLSTFIHNSYWLSDSNGVYYTLHTQIK